MTAMCPGASTEVTARGVNALATWMIEHPLEDEMDGSDEIVPAGGVASPAELPTPPSPELPTLSADRCAALCISVARADKLRRNFFCQQMAMSLDLCVSLLLTVLVTNRAGIGLPLYLCPRPGTNKFLCYPPPQPRPPIPTYKIASMRFPDPEMSIPWKVGSS